MSVRRSAGLIRDLGYRRFLPATTNFVQRMMYSNCQVPFYLYLTTAVPAAVDAALLLTIPLWDDLARSRGESLARGPGARRSGARHLRRHKEKPPPKSPFDKRYSNGLRHLLTITQPLETIGFGLLLYGAIDGFFYDWQAYLDNADACLNPNFYGPLIQANNDFAMLPNATLGGISLSTIISDPNHWSGGAFGCVLPVGKYKVVMAVTATGPGGGETDYRLGLLGTFTLPGGHIYGEPVTFRPGQQRDMVAEWDIFIANPTGGALSWGIAGPSVPIGLQIAKADIYVQRQGTPF